MLDKKEKIYDIVLTNKGRELLSKNQLNFTWYAFSDQIVDYSGSIDDVSKTTGSFDDYTQKLFVNEADQRKTRQNNDLKSFLFTAPVGTRVLPEFRISLTGSIDLKRKFKTISFIDAIKNKSQANLVAKINYEPVFNKQFGFLKTQQQANDIVQPAVQVAEKIDSGDDLNKKAKKDELIKKIEVLKIQLQSEMMKFGKGNTKPIIDKITFLTLELNKLG